MQVIIDEELFEDEKSYQLLDKVFDTFFENRHFLKTDSFPLPDFSKTGWFRDARKAMQRELNQKFLVSTIHENTRVDKRNKYIKISTKKDTSNMQITLNAAIKYLLQPLKIILENDKSDRAFFDFCLKIYDNQVIRLIKAIDEEWVEFIHAGGVNNITRKHEEEINRILSNEITIELAWLSVYILLDSDRRVSGNNKNKNIEPTFKEAKTKKLKKNKKNLVQNVIFKIKVSWKSLKNRKLVHQI